MLKRRNIVFVGTIKIGKLRTEQCSPPLVFPRTKGARARLCWPLTSKSSIYDQFLAHFTRANNGRLHRSIIFIRRSNQCMYGCTHVYKYLFYPALHICIFTGYSGATVHFFSTIFSKIFDNREKWGKSRITMIIFLSTTSFSSAHRYIWKIVSEYCGNGSMICHIFFCNVSLTRYEDISRKVIWNI